MSILSVIGLINRFSFLSDPNLRLEVPSYKFLRGFCSGDTLSRRFSIFSPLGVCCSGLGISRGLINLPVSGGFQGFSSFSFSPIAFIPDVVSGILKVF